MFGKSCPASHDAHIRAHVGKEWERGWTRDGGVCHEGLRARLTGWPLPIEDRVFVGIFHLAAPDQTCALGRLVCLRWGGSLWETVCLAAYLY